MRFFTTLLVAGALAVASAQSTTVSADSAQTSAQSEMLKCLDACTAGDVACTSKCIAVPNPNASQVNQTNECIAACPQGNGTASDILNYKNCQDGCIGKYYYTTGGTPQATGGNAGSGAGSTGTITSGASSAPTGSTSGSASGAAASSTSKAAADVVRVAGPAAGLFGFIAAILAL